MYIEKIVVTVRQTRTHKLSLLLEPCARILLQLSSITSLNKQEKKELDTILLLLLVRAGFCDNQHQEVRLELEGFNRYLQNILTFPVKQSFIFCFVGWVYCSSSAVIDSTLSCDSRMCYN